MYLIRGREINPKITIPTPIFTPKNRTLRPVRSKNSRMRFNLSAVLPHAAALAVFLLVSAFYFLPQFSGKVISQGDIIGYKGMSEELRQYKAKTGEDALWTNSMFSGMPSYQINTISSGNQVKKLERVVRLFLAPPAGQFIAAMVSFYILMVLLGVSPWLAIIGGVAFGFSTNNLVLYEAGHETKLRVISYLPLIASGLLLAFRQRYLLGGTLFGIGLALDLAANHVQMTYYFFLTVLIWGIAELVVNAKNGTWVHFAKAAGVLIIGGLLAVGSAASNLLVTYEYSHDTMRGKPVLEKTATAPKSATSSDVEGLEWEYAMQWSNGTLDLFASFIPGVVGGGSAQPTTNQSEYGKTLNRIGARMPATFDAPLYWGDLPFTSGPAYFGAVMVMLFFIGLFLVDGPVKWWLGLGTLLTLILSMGNNMEVINRFFFDYFPLYNKFRTPNSVLSVTSFLVPALGILALHQIITGKVARDKALKSVALGGGIAVAIALFFLLLGGSWFDFSAPGDADQLNRMFGGQLTPDMLSTIVNSLQATRAELMASDALRTLVLVLLAGAGLYFFLQEKIKATPLLVLIGLLTLYDLTGVGMRYLNKADFERPTNVNAVFQPREVDTQILADKDPHYRVFDATINAFNSAQPSFHHKMIGGYHAAKLQRYQDIIERHLTQNNQGVFNMLNTKYFILPGQDGQPAVQQNPNALGNAWWADSIAIVGSNNAEIDALGTLDLRKAAAIHQEFADYVANIQPAGEGSSIRLTDYRPNQLTYASSSQKEALAVFSEVWYGPNKGWQAYIDGQPVDHIRANYVLRALKIPAGQHEIVFKFEPQSYKTGTLVSNVSSILLLLLLLGYVAMWLKKGQTTV